MRTFAKIFSLKKFKLFEQENFKKCIEKFELKPKNTLTFSALSQPCLAASALNHSSAFSMSCS
jgi:hypothetical protein